MLISQLVAPQDALFLIPETREQPMHVGSLSLYEPPAGAADEFVADLYQQAMAADPASLQRRFRKRPVRSLATLGQWAWVYDDEVDLEHHVRHSALARPGRIRELLALVSRLHSAPLDRQRPPWELHLIEGLADGRFAVYSKVHHALLDGVAGMRLVSETLSEDPDERDMALPFIAQRRGGRPGGKAGGRPSVNALARGAAEVVTGTVGLAPRLLRIAESAVREQAVALPLRAPRTVLNGPITGSRRFAADDWPIDRLRAVADAAGATLNDVLLAMCGGALRRYLGELDAVPESSLVAMAPVSLRREKADGVEEEGNAVGAVLVLLGTHLEDALARLELVKESADHAKGTLRGLNQLQATALSTVTLAPMALTTAFHEASLLVPPTFNLVVSNVPGPRRTVYFNGARLVGLYPLSIPTSGQALNVTVVSYDGRMHVGIVGCRKTLPHMQRLLAGLEDELVALEQGLGVAGAA